MQMKKVQDGGCNENLIISEIIQQKALQQQKRKKKFYDVVIDRITGETQQSPKPTDWFGQRRGFGSSSWAISESNRTKKSQHSSSYFSKQFSIDESANNYSSFANNYSGIRTSSKSSILHPRSSLRNMNTSNTQIKPPDPMKLKPNLVQGRVKHNLSVINQLCMPQTVRANNELQQLMTDGVKAEVVASPYKHFEKRMKRGK